MIEKAVSFKTGDGKIFGTIEEAQEHELDALLGHYPGSDASSPYPNACKAIMAKREKVMDILTMTPSSRPKARKANGATRKKSDKKVPAVTEAAPAA